MFKMKETTQPYYYLDYRFSCSDKSCNAKSSFKKLSQFFIKSTNFYKILLMHKKTLALSCALVQVSEKWFNLVWIE